MNRRERRLQERKRSKEKAKGLEDGLITINTKELARELNKWSITEERAAELDQELDHKPWLFTIQSYAMEDMDGNMHNVTVQKIVAYTENEARDIAAWRMPARLFHRIALIEEVTENGS